MQLVPFTGELDQPAENTGPRLVPFEGELDPPDQGSTTKLVPFTGPLDGEEMDTKPEAARGPFADVFVPDVAPAPSEFSPETPQARQEGPSTSAGPQPAASVLEAPSASEFETYKPQVLPEAPSSLPIESKAPDSGTRQPVPPAFGTLVPFTGTLDEVSTAPEARSDDEDSWGQVIARTVENVPDTFKRFVGGFLQWWGENTPVNRVSSGLRALKRIEQLPPEQRGEHAVSIFEEEIRNDPAARKGREMHREASVALEANAPRVPYGSPKYYGGAIFQTVIEMGPAVALSLATRNPNVGIGVIGSQVYSDQYAISRSKGRSESEAQQDALFYAAIEAISERIPLGVLTRAGGRLLKRTLKVAGAEGAQEVINEALQLGYQKGVLNEDMTLAQALMSLRDAGIIGTGAGGGLAVITQPVASRARARERAREAEKSSLIRLKDLMEDPRPVAEIRAEDEARAAAEAPVTIEVPTKGAGTRDDPVKAETATDVDRAAMQADPNPTDAMKESGNYRKGHVKFKGFDIAIENSAGSVRSGKDAGGQSWSVEMKAHYGYIKKSEGKDGDQVDVYVGPRRPERERVRGRSNRSRDWPLR